MALTKEFLTGVFEGITDEQVDKVLKEHESELTGLKVNKDAILGESKGYKEKLDKLTAEYETEKTGFQKRIEELEGKIKASGSEETKAFYEAEKKQIQDMFAAKVAEADARAKAQEKAFTELREKHIGVIIDTEIDRALDKIANLDRAKANMLRDLIKTRNHFEPTPVDGEEKMLSKDYKSIGDTINSFISTDEGKFFQLANSSGGGASGATAPKPQIGNPFIKGKENLDEQGRLFRENRSLYDQLKGQAVAQT